MSLFCSAARNDYVNVGSAAVLDDLGTITFIMWIRPTDVSKLNGLIGKWDGAANGWSCRIRTGGQFQIIRLRATTNMTCTTTDAGLADGTWACIAGLLDVTGGAVKAYSGSLTAAMFETAYSPQTVGAGAVNTDASVNMLLGNRGTAVAGWQGDLGPVAIFNRVLTVGEMRDWQFNPRVMAGCVGFWRPGDNGTGTQPDYSGNGNSGTVTTATQSDNPPLQYPWGRRIMQPLYGAIASAFTPRGLWFTRVWWPLLMLGPSLYASLFTR